MVVSLAWSVAMVHTNCLTKIKPTHFVNPEVVDTQSVFLNPVALSATVRRIKMLLPGAHFSGSALDWCNPQRIAGAVCLKCA